MVKSGLIIEGKLRYSSSKGERVERLLILSRVPGNYFIFAVSPKVRNPFFPESQLFPVLPEASLLNKDTKTRAEVPIIKENIKVIPTCGHKHEATQSKTKQKCRKLFQSICNVLPEKKKIAKKLHKTTFCGHSEKRSRLRESFDSTRVKNEIIRGLLKGKREAGKWRDSSKKELHHYVQLLTRILRLDLLE